MVQKQKEKVAKDALMAIVSKWFDRAALDKINVHSEDDYAGDPALFVNVRLKSSKDRLPPDKAVDLRIAMRNALQQIGDDRFPYVTFSAPDDDLAEPEARKSA
jgi:hypothetical protein